MSWFRRKNKDRIYRGFVFPFRYALVLAGIAVIALTYLLLCNRCDAMGKQIKVLERELADVHKRRVNEEFKWSNLRSPANIEQALLRHQLVMRWPDKTRVVRLSPPETTVPGKRFLIAMANTNSVLSRRTRVALNE